MGRRKLEEKNIKKLMRTGRAGGSLYTPQQNILSLPYPPLYAKYQTFYIDNT